MAELMLPAQVKLRPMGLEFIGQLSETEWLRACKPLQDQLRKADAAQFLWGDMLAYGLTFEPKKNGDLPIDWAHRAQARMGRYKLALGWSDRTFQTLQQYCWVCRSVSISRRREALTFSHHVEVAKLEPKDQERWLKSCEDHDWSVMDLRQHLRTNENKSTKLIGVAFDATRSIHELVRWANTQAIDSWDCERKLELARELKPIADLYNRLR